MGLNYFKIKLFLLAFFLYINTFALLSQTDASFSVNIKWNGIEELVIYDDTIKYLDFTNASYDDIMNDGHPLYRCSFPIYSDDVDVNLFIDNLCYEKMPDEESLLLNTAVDTLPLYNYYIKTSRDNQNLCFEIMPFFKKDDVLMRLLSFDVHYSLKNINKRSVYHSTDNSVLASGKWYKISLTSTGMYKITYSELVSMGVPVDAINPKNIRLYHNGGGVLPVINKEKRHDDLVEIPIYISGENDGSFDAEDYIVFYARGPVTWKLTNGVYEKQSNPYSDYSYVFMTTDLGEGKRVENAAVIEEDADVVVDSFLDYQYVEKDEQNLNNMGATWYFDKFDAVLSRSYSFNFPNIVKDKKCNLYAEVASRNYSKSDFIFKANGVTIKNLPSTKNASTSLYANMLNTGDVKFNSNKDNITIDLSYSRTTSSSSAWLDYISINAWRKLKFVPGVMIFRNPECFNAEKIYRYDISNASKSMQLWDVTEPTEPKKIQLQFSSNVASFAVKGSPENEFVAFDGSSYKNVNFVSFAKINF